MSAYHQRHDFREYKCEKSIFSSSFRAHCGSIAGYTLKLDGSLNTGRGRVHTAHIITTSRTRQRSLISFIALFCRRRRGFALFQAGVGNNFPCIQCTRRVRRGVHQVRGREPSLENTRDRAGSNEIVRCRFLDRWGEGRGGGWTQEDKRSTEGYRAVSSTRISLAISFPARSKSIRASFVF